MVLNLNKLFDLKKYSSNIALITDKQEITYQELDDLVCKFSEEFIAERSLILLVCTNTIESVIAYISIIKSGSVCLLVGDTNIDELLVKYKPKFVFSPKNKNIDLEAVKEFDSYKLYKTNFDIDYKLNDKLAILLTTSGSTGSPKFVRLSYRNIISNTISISEYLDITSNDRVISTMPMNYTYGLSKINTHLLNGASIILTESTLMSREFWDILKEKQATNFGGVPYIYEMLKKLRFEKMDLPSLRYITQAGGKLSKNLVIDFYEVCSKKNIDFIVMYGQTEATSRMSYLPPKSLPNKADSIGIAIPNGKFIIKDDSGNTIENSGESGELIYYGENVSMGYSESCYDLIEPDINNGCLYTGDLAKKDTDGYFYIAGRKKRFLKVYGNRVSLDELEQIIKSYGYECACSGEDDKLVIYLVDNQIDKTELLFKLMTVTGLNKNAFNIVFIDEIPRNESGKTLYYKLDELGKKVNA